MESITNLITIKSNQKLKMSLDGDFFRAWVEFLRPLHKLAKREMDVLAAFLKERYELNKVITDQNVLDKMLMSRETKQKIRGDCNMSIKQFQGINTKFKKNGVVKDGKIPLTLIPNIKEEGVGLMIYFSFKDEQRIKLSNY